MKESTNLPTFNDLPAYVEALHRDLAEVKKILMGMQSKLGSDPDDEMRPINIREAARYLDLEIPTIYSKISRGQIPHFKRDKRVYFTKKLLREYLAKGRVKSSAEIEDEALSAIKKRGAEQ